MAITKKKETSLNKKRNDYIIQGLTIAMGILSIVIYAFTRNIHSTIFIVVVCFIISIRFTGKTQIYDYGIKGELAIANELLKLNNKYLIYNDIVIGGKEKGAQIDHLVVSPYGLFCIETKNMRGTIIGKEDDDNWIQRKAGKDGKIYEKQFYNPCKQSSGHVNALKNMLSHGNFRDIKVYSVVVFNHNFDTKLEIKTKVTTVIELDKLINFMQSEKNSIMDSNKIKAMIKLIDKEVE